MRGACLQTNKILWHGKSVIECRCQCAYSCQTSTLVDDAGGLGLGAKCDDFLYMEIVNKLNSCGDSTAHNTKFKLLWAQQFIATWFKDGHVFLNSNMAFTITIYYSLCPLLVLLFTRFLFFSLLTCVCQLLNINKEVVVDDCCNRLVGSITKV